MIRGQLLRKIASLTAVGLAMISISEPARGAELRDGSFAISGIEHILSGKEVMAVVYHTDECPVYAGADEASEVKLTLKQGHTVYIRGAVPGDPLMYEVSCYSDGNEYTGYISADHLVYSDEDLLKWEKEHLNGSSLPYPYISMEAGSDILSEAVEADDAYEDVAQFPQTYREALNALKNLHHDWVFVPLETGLDFNSAVDNEMGDKSWIYINDSNKEKGWVGDPTGQGKWAYATKAGVSYHMDPRNFLTESYIFQFEQLTFNKSYHSAAAVQSFLDQTFMKGSLPNDTMSYADAFYNIGSDLGVSPVHLASRVYQEQGKGTSPLISGTYEGFEGYYNYFNIGATGKTDSEVIKNGLQYAKDHGWDTPYKSLAGGATTIGNSYIKKGQDTGYLQKFNIAPGSAHALYTHQYMQNIQAPRSEASGTKKMYADAGSLNSPFVFKIPVFKNMKDRPAGSTGISIKKAVISGIEAREYTGNEEDVKCVPVLTLKDGTVLSGITKDEYDTLNDSEAGKYDFTYSYKNIHKAGKASIKIKGVNKYKGTVTKTYKIKKASFAQLYELYAGGEVSADEIHGFCIKYYSSQDALLHGIKVNKNGVGLAEDEVIKAGVSVNSIRSIEEITDVYLKGGSRPQIILYFAGTQLDKKSFGVTFKRCGRVTSPETEDNKRPVLTITGKGNFKGKIKGSYSITDGDLANENKVSITAADKKYSKKKNAWKAAVRLKDIDGKKLKAGKDYEKPVKYTYAEDDPAVIDAVSGEPVRRSAGETVSANDIPQEGTVIRASVTGKGAYAGKDRPAVRSVTYSITGGK